MTEKKTLDEIVVKGAKKVLMFRLASERATKDASKLALQVSHTIKYESKSESVMTKDGAVNSSGESTVSIEMEALQSDTETNDLLAYAAKKGLTIEVWEIDFTKPVSGSGETKKYEAQYGTGNLSGWETPAEAEGNASIKTTMNINGALVKGHATVTEQQELEAKLFFYDTVKNSQAVEPLPEYGGEEVKPPVNPDPDPNPETRMANTGKDNKK